MSNNNDNNITNSTIPAMIRVETINIKGINTIVKQDNLKTICKDNLMDIVGVSETKLRRKENAFCMNKHKLYQAYWSSDPEQLNAGVGLIINKMLAKHIIRIEKYQGHIIFIDLYFKKKKAEGYISIYKCEY